MNKLFIDKKNYFNESFNNDFAVTLKINLYMLQIHTNMERHAVIWTIWASQNDLIFAGGLFREELVVDRVKLLAWKWFMAKCSASSYSLYEWEAQPVLC